MNIQEITSRKEWNEFFDKSDSPSFLQSWEWGEFEKKMGYEILRLGLYDQSELQAIALVIKIKAKRGNFLFIPHGPVMKMKDERLKIKDIIKKIRDYLIDFAKKEGYEFIRIGPLMENTPQNQKLFKDLGFKTAPIYIHSEDFWMLPLITTLMRPSRSCISRADDKLLSQMRKTTRYLIKKAIRDGVVIEKRTDEKAADDFWQLYQETVKRERFSAYPKQYIKNEFEAFHKTGNAVFLFGKIKNGSTSFNQFQPISTNFNYLASALILFTKSGAFYHQGASIHSKIPVPYLLQWEAIKEAKKRGCKFYNFWGILIPGRTPKAWEGLTTFKTGFGGYEYKCIPTQDYIISSKYYLTYLYEKFLQWKRGV